MDAATLCAPWIRVGVNYVSHLVLDNTWKENGTNKYELVEIMYLTSLTHRNLYLTLAMAVCRPESNILHLYYFNQK